MRAFFRNTDSQMPEERYAHGKRLYSSQRAPPATRPGFLWRNDTTAFHSTKMVTKMVFNKLYG